MAAFISVLIATYLSDKHKRRGTSMLTDASLSVVGYTMLISTRRSLIQYGGTFLVGKGIFSCSPIVMCWLANNTAPHYVRATASGFQIGIANCTAFIATFTYIVTDMPRLALPFVELGKCSRVVGYITGHAINIGVLVLCLVIMTTTMIYCRVENRKRDRGERDDKLTGDQKSIGS